MSKIICDICGTSYPETAKQCPICGCVRPGDVQRVTNEVKRDGKVSTGYTYVKGGRFSKSNVKKRGQTGTSASGAEKAASRQNQLRHEEKSNRGLVITAIVLLLAIIGVVIYIAVRFFGPLSGSADQTPSSNIQQNAEKIVCTDLTLDINTILFELEGEGRLLQVEPKPEGTKEPITFRSENEEVATVSAAGKVTAVGEGTTKIIITCGNIKKECVVTCKFGEDSTDDSSSDTTDDTSEDTTGGEQTDKPAETLRLNRKDEFTLFYEGDSWILYSGSIAKNLISWSSDDESVVTFKDGKVVALRHYPEGVMVHAEYEGQKVSCLVRCNFTNGNGGVAGNGGVSEDGGSSSNGGSGSGKVTGRVNVQEALNIRSGPGTNYSQVGTLGPNDRVTITEQKTVDGMTWGKIGTDQWVSMNYIVLD